MKLPTLCRIALTGAGLLIWASSHAQIIGAANDTTPRIWKVRFQGDIKVKSLSLTETDAYQGERYAADANGVYSWSWLTYDKTTKGLHTTSSVYSQRLNVLVNIWKELYAGFGYTSLIVVPPVTPNAGVLPSTRAAFSTGIVAQYNYLLPIPRYANRIALQPQVSYGAYIAPNDGYGLYGNKWEGPGNERFVEGILGLQVTPFHERKLGFRVWGSYSQFMYRESEISYIYRDRTRTARFTEQFWAVGVGASYTIHIREDQPRKVHTPGTRKKKHKPS